MNRSRRTRNNHVYWFFFICIGLAILISATTIFRGRAATPSSGSISPTTVGSVTFTGSATGTGAQGGEGQCVAAASNCDTYLLTVTNTENDWVGKLIQIRISWSLQGDDYDLFIHKCPTGVTDAAGCNKGPLAAQGMNQGAPGTQEIAFLDAHANGVGLYSVHIDYGTNPVSNTDQPQGEIKVVPAPPAATQDSGLSPRFQNMYPQTSLFAVGKGLDAGEPSVGANWKTSNSMYISYLTTFRVTFDDTCPTSPTSIWLDKSAPNNADSLDPILFTDHGYNNTNPDTGRTFASELSGQDSLTAFTDDDGDNWTPSQGGGIPSGVDHQSIGAGPFHAPLVGLAYPHAVYYCSQSIAAAFCARSDNGGVTFGPGVPIYNQNQCGGLHGRPKVGPDGTVYVPNRGCFSTQAAVVSEDNGMTWQVRQIQGTPTSDSDPSIAIGRGDKITSNGLPTGQPVGRVYAAFSSSNSIAGVAISDDRGLTWKKVVDVGALAGIKAVAFPTMVAGDDDRAAIAFLGSPTQGTVDDKLFPGTFHLYVGATYNGGDTWQITDVTPNDPVQRNGIHLGGGSPIHRNLLDFIVADLDKQGRILVGYADGCTGPACVQATASATGNSYSEMAVIARQSGGRRLFSGGDPAVPTVPGAPYLTVGRDGGTAKLTWSESDNGGSAITNYAVLRGTASNNLAFLANAGTATSFNDSTADANTTYFYRITATNSIGISCGSSDVKSVPLGESQCNGLQEVIDPAGDQKSAPTNPDLDITEIRVADRVIGGKEKIVFRMRVSDLSTLPPGRNWRIIWNYPVPCSVCDPVMSGGTPFTGSYYIGMNTDSSATPVVSFEYGTVTTVEAVPANTATPNKIGTADAESNVDKTNGIITLVISADKVGTPKVGDVLGTLIGRTFAGNADQSLRSNAAIDTTSGVGAQDPYTGISYRLVGNADCVSAPSPTPTPSPSPSPSVSPTPTPTPTPVATFQFNSASYTTQEACTAFNVTVIRAGVTSTTAAVDVTSADATAKQKGDYTLVIAHLVFAPNETQKTFQVLISDDGYAEGTESATLVLQNPTNGTLGSPNAATLQIVDNTPETSSNPIDISRTFACQHYHDFLYREGDLQGQDFWTNNIESCGANAQCRQVKRIDTSTAFFLSIEFKETGYLLIRAHKAAFGNSKSVPRYNVFLRDQREIAEGVIVGQGNWQDQLNTNKQNYLNDFVTRSEFTSKPSFAPGAPAATYVDALFANSGATPTTAERNAAISAYGSGDTAGRSAALKSVIESGSVFNKLYNDAFVLMQYYGYLRRNPDDAPDNNFSGYDFWLTKLNSFSQPGEDMRDDAQAFERSKRAEMVRAFIESIEYRERFFGRSTGNQFAPPDEGGVATFIKAMVRFTLFGDAAG
jgi:hypothetical protein